MKAPSVQDARFASVDQMFEHSVHGREQWPGCPPTFRRLFFLPAPLSWFACQSIGGTRLGGIGGVLFAQRQLPFQIRDLLFGVRDLPLLLGDLFGLTTDLLILSG